MAAARPRLLASRVARRLLLLFVLAAFVPLAVSSWLSSSAVTDLVDAYTRRHESRNTQQVARQVLDRLVLARTLMQSWPAGRSRLPDLLPGHGSVFLSEARLDHGALTWSSLHTDVVASAWQSLQRDAAKSNRKDTDLASGQVRVWHDHGRARVLMALRLDSASLWLAELEPTHLWQPVIDAAATGQWQVLDDRGQTLLQRGEGERSEAAIRESLFLGAEFGSADWVFVQQRSVASPYLQGQRLSVWLGLVALATVLLVTLISLTQIRRTLVPLQQLMAGTRRLAGGDAAARVPVQSADEFGALAAAFNHMAGRIEGQFAALEGLAEIDRAILNGEDTAAVVDRVLMRLAAVYPSAWSAVVWLSGDPNAPQPVGVVRAPGLSATLPAQRLVLDAGDAKRFAALADAQQGGRKTVPRTPWCALVRQPGVRWLAQWPVHVQGQCRALLMLGLNKPAREAALQPARELSDRLAVALGARQRERQLAHQAVHDSLTGLANRHGLHQALQAWLEPAEGGADSVGRGALMFIDLDHFKHINDSLGHDAGDAVLREAARRLLDVQRERMPVGSTVSRPGGDEFVLVLPGADERRARDVAAEVLSQLGRPFEVGGVAHVMGASIGIALAPAHGTTEVDLLRHADLAMYAAKAGGRHRAEVFEPAMDEQAHQRVQLVAELRQAIARNEFVAFYQPRVDAQGVVTSAEALVRWQHPKRGLLAPGAFIALAETSDELIEGIGVAMLEAACSQMARWRRTGVHLPRVSVNVSTRQLSTGRVLSQVRSALARHNLPAEALELEVTESLLVGNVEQARGYLAELRRWGVTIALDDFGTGYSSMALLRELPIDVIKIDRAFVKDLGRDDGALAIAQAIVALARSLKLHLVAEGVETPQQAQLLQQLGCDELQGFLYSPPVDVQRFVRLPGLGRTDVARDQELATAH